MTSTDYSLSTIFAENYLTLGATGSGVIGAIVEDLFQPSSLETLNFAVGRSTVDQTLPHTTALRQFEPGLLVYSNNKALTLSADDVAQAWGFNNRENETPVPISILDLPIDPDKFINWTNYYWIDVGMPVIFVTGGSTESFDVANDIIGKQYYTTPIQRNGRSLELKNGMRIAFQQHIHGDVSTTYISTGQHIDSIKY